MMSETTEHCLSRRFSRYLSNTVMCVSNTSEHYIGGRLIGLHIITAYLKNLFFLPVLSHWKQLLVRFDMKVFIIEQVKYFTELYFYAPFSYNRQINLWFIKILALVPVFWLEGHHPLSRSFQTALKWWPRFSLPCQCTEFGLEYCSTHLLECVWLYGS